jgi:beta-glucanase (GH16 family)
MTHYTFEDNFTGPLGAPPHPALWVNETGRWTDNDELETYTASPLNSYLDGEGHLVLEAHAVPTAPGEYTSARLTTQGRFSQYGGCFEARIRLNPQAGLWPAWWMIGANYPDVGWPACGEIDMLEQYGGLTPPYIESTVHVPDGHGGVRDPVMGVTYEDMPLTPGWHTYRLWWTPELLRFTMDGVHYLAVTPQTGWTYSAGVPMFMILNLAVGGTGGGDVPADFSSAQMLVDYVRAWEA